MFPKKLFLSTLLIPLAAIAFICLVFYPFHGKSSDGRLRTNTERCVRARQRLREADQSFADAIAGLRQIPAAHDRLVIGDRHLVSRYIQQITEIRERLNQVSEETDRAFRGVILPEFNAADED
jgi:hypothetical protein